MTLDAILDDWREKAASSKYNKERIKGTAFERLCKIFLTHDPVQKNLYEPPITYADWADANGLDKRDIGIDLVAKIKYSDTWCAIQCKFHAKGKKLSKADIDSFLAVASQKFFRQRIIIDASGVDLTENLKNTLRLQNPEVVHIGLHSLQNSAIDWGKFFNDDVVQLKEKKTPLPHQTEAIQKVVAGLKDPDSRGMLLMACGTGKTFTSLKIAEELVTRIGGGYVLYLVPSLGLMSQTVRDWANDTRFARFFAVCSDTEVGKPVRERNDYGMDKLDLEFPATTDAEEVASRAKSRTPGQMTVVFATYQSLRVISEAQHKYGFPDFDLAICDEAHRTAGYSKKSEEESSFLIIHNQEKIRAARRLYMTATPKVYTATSKTRASKSGDMALYSMEDREIFGDVLYKIGFSKAVDNKLLTDFKVIISAVTSGEVPTSVSGAMSEHELPLDDAGKIVSFWRTLAKIDQEQFGLGENLPMKSAIAYCGTIRDSQRMADSFRDTVAQYRSEEGESQMDQRLLKHDVDTRHIDGRNSALQRAKSLAWLDRAESGTSRILFNVRCLSEGVDVPSLDAIIFLRPRRSTIDIAQAVGRVMRKAKGKKVGYVILPVVVPEDVDPHEALNNNKTFEVIWKVLNALRSHDSGLERDLNLLEAGKAGEGRISILMSKELKYRSKPSGSLDTPSGSDDDHDEVTVHPGIDFLAALSAKIVENVGDKLYYPRWAEDTARIVQNSTARIEDWVTRHNSAYVQFQQFHKEIQDDLNDGVSEEDAIKMLSTHMVTRPVFEALFGKARFVDKNPIVKGLDTVLKVLEPANIESELEGLHDMYESVKMRAMNANTPIARQKLVKSLYEEFLKKAFEKETEMFGVVYTPIEVIDFILHSVDEVLQKEFEASISSEGVQILDPFTGMGTFIVRMIESGLINKKALPRKYRSEIHANEIMLLPYYLATVNIEEAYHARADIDEYERFSGIILTDTFALNEGDGMVAELLPENSEQIKRQKSSHIRVIIGNPPWRVGQKSENDAARNQSYPALKHKIENSYAKYSTASNKNSLYNSYIQAIRWASDRIGDSGVIGFVTPSNWLDGVSMDGMRKCLAEGFSTIYILDLCGNTVTDGSANVFDGIKTASAISIFVKNPAATTRKILYSEIGYFKKREDKIDQVNALHSIRGLENQWVEIKPNAHHDWLNQRDARFEGSMVMGDKKRHSTRCNFKNYSRGIATCRDAWCYNYSENALWRNIQAMIRFYERERARLQEQAGKGRKWTAKEITNFVNNDPTKISWTVNLKDDLAKDKELTSEEGRVTIAQYRPFTRSHMYLSRRLNERVYQMPRIFPHADAENRVICVTGKGATTPFSCIMADKIPDLEVISKSQCFPRWLYTKPGERKIDNPLFAESIDLKTDQHGYIRESAIKDDALQAFEKKMGGGGYFGR